MMDMAVGVIIGGAFSGLVESLTNNFINPILNFVTGAATYNLQDIAGFGSTFVGVSAIFVETATSSKTFGFDGSPSSSSKIEAAFF